jgi:MFS family permease
LAWSGISIAYYSGNLVEMMSLSLKAYKDDDNYEFYWSMLAMVGFGLGEIFGAFFIGFIIDRLGTKVAIVCDLIIILLMNGFTLAFIYQFKFNALPWIMCFLWGFQDSAVNTQI